MKKNFAMALFILIAAIAAFGQKDVRGTENAPPSRYVSKTEPARIPRLETPPTIDGQLDDATWANATVFGDFIQTDPGDNIAPSHPTEVMMGYDAKHLYIAFKIIQDRDKVRATVARRDNIFNDDHVGVYLDTFNDQRQAYALFFNPLGVQTDGIFTEGRGGDYSVDIVMDSKGVLTPEGFTVEVAIPFKSLRYEAGKGKMWGVHIHRYFKHANNEINSWMRLKRGSNSLLDQAGKITGLEKISTTRQLEINPSFTPSQSGRRSRHTFDGNPAGRFVNEGLSAEFGLATKFSLTPTITLDFAYNPDFAQVEADAPVTTANLRFPIFFPEKRPFFLERIDIFQTRMNLVNTRAIVDPDLAVKLTGRRGNNTFGLIYASDNAPGNYSEDEREDLLQCQQRRLSDPSVVCGIERFVDKNANIGVLRIKRDIGRQHHLGFFATTYNFIGRHNHTAGFDGRFRLSSKTVAEFQVIGTNSRRNFYDSESDRTLYRTGNGFGYSYLVERSGRNWFISVDGEGRTSDYRADVGFTPRVDTNRHRSLIRYETERDATKPIIFKRVFNETEASHDWQGRTQNWSTNTRGTLGLQRQTIVYAGVEFGYERIMEREFGASRNANRRGAFFGSDSERSSPRKGIYVVMESQPVKQWFFRFGVLIGNGDLDFDFGAGPKYPRVSPIGLLNRNSPFPPGSAENPLDPGPGKKLDIFSVVRYQPTAAWQIELNTSHVRLVRNDTKKVAFDDNIFSLRSTYQFTRNTLRVCASTIQTSRRACARSWFWAGRRIPARRCSPVTTTITMFTATTHTPDSANPVFAATVAHFSSKPLTFFVRVFNDIGGGFRLCSLYPNYSFTRLPLLRSSLRQVPVKCWSWRKPRVTAERTAWQRVSGWNSAPWRTP